MPPVRSRTVTELMARHGHEQVVFVADAAAGLRAVIAIHSTALGPSLGGVRFRHYGSESEAIADALRLSEAMSLKASMAGLHQGGGKAVVHWDDPDRPRPRAVLEALGRAIDELGGRYLAAEDVGATTSDMDGLARVTPWVTGVNARSGGSGDPSPVTAFGVICSMRAALEELDGDSSLAGRTVHVVGVGHVGGPLVDLLVAAEARVSVSDVFADRVAVAVDRHGVDVHAADHALSVACDVLAPCALGGVFDDVTVPQLQCRVIAGAANNQLASERAADQLAERDILFVPDFVASAGGIINIAEEFVGYDRARALKRAAAVGPTTARVLRSARDRGVTPQRAAEDLARARIIEEGQGRRWNPGDPAAWTNGAPLTRLRPRSEGG
jgi:leucine dehydrogenase